MKFLVLLKHDIKHLISNQGNVFMFTIFPVVMVLLFGFLFSNMYKGTFVSAYDFYGVTMIFFTAMMGATVPANAFLEKTIKEGNTRIFYTPVSRVQIYLSKILACFIFISTLLIVDVIVLSLLGIVNFGGISILHIILLLAAFVLFLILLSSAICVTIRSEEITNTIISNSMSVLALLSGIMFPIASLGEWADKLSNFSPLKWVLNSTFELIYNGGSPNYVLILVGLIALSIPLLFVVHKNYRPEDYI